MDPEANKKLAFAFFEAVAAGDVGKLDALLTDDASWWVMPSTALSGTHPKSEFLKMVPEILGQAAGPFTFRFDDVTAEADRVAVTCKGHLPMKNGKIYASHYHFLFYIRDGKIAGGKEYLDTAHLADVLG